MPLARIASSKGRRAVAALASAWMVSAASAQSLVESYERALENDRQWRVAQARQRESRELLPLARSQILPQVNFNASANRVEQTLQTGELPAVDQRYLSTVQSLSVRQVLFRPRVFLAVDQAQAQTEQALLSLREEEQQLAVRTVNAYLNVMLAVDRRDLLAAQSRLVEGRLASAQAALRAGQGTRNDVDDAVAERDRIQAQAIQVEQGIQLARRQLQLIIGAEPTAIQRLAAARFDPAVFRLGSLEDELAKAVRASNRIQATRQEVFAAHTVLQQANTGHLPTVDLIAQAASSTGENTFFATTKARNLALGVQVTVPIYAGGAVEAQIRQARSRLDVAEESLAALINAQRLQVNTEFNAVLQGIALVRALRTAVASAEQALLSSQKGQLAGVRSLIDVLRAENRRIEVELDLAQARYQTMGAWIRLQALTGQLDRSVIETLQALLVPSP